MSCKLCDLPTPDPPITAPDTDGEFCCRGCLEVQRRLGEDAEAALEDNDDDLGTEPVPEGCEQAFLAVDGMHCSTCEVFVESLGSDIDGVDAAEASYASELLRVVYDPDRVDSESLPERLSGYGYEARLPEESAEDDGSDVVRFLIGGGFFGMMAMLWYVLFLYPTYFGYPPLVDLGGFAFAYIAANIWVFTSVVLFYTGYPLLRGAYVSLRAGRPNTDLLVSLAAVGAYVYSTLALALGRTELYFDVTIAIVLVVTAGTQYESRIKRRASDLLSELTELRVEEATRHPSGEVVAVSTVEPGDDLLVKPGDRIPVDGTVAEGSAAVDEALVTGESLPRSKTPGDDVRGGTVVTNAPLVVRAGEEVTSTLDRLVELLWRIQSSRPGAQRLADRLATVFVPLVVVLAMATTGWLLASGAAPAEALLTGLTVLIVSCPCALGLATPLAVASGTRAAAARNVVVATPALFEAAPEADTVVFDKTGTLTTGAMTLREVRPVDTDRDSLLARAAALEHFSAHPIATAITDAVEETPEAADVETHERGVSGSVDGTATLVGHPSLFADRGWTIPESVADSTESVRSEGSVPVVVGWDERARGVVAVGDETRAEWEAVAETFADREVVVLTGDEGASADRLRADPNVDRVFSGVKPAAKAETVRRLRADGTVAMVGDGSNDAPALAAADVGIALAGGTQLATEAADAVVVDDDLRSVPDTFDIAAATNRRIKSNLAWAFGYNAVAIPLAVFGLLNPLFAAVAMASSSLLVVVNSSRSLGP
ncbi:cation-translocating P-type ATPase [Natronomonas gomsonensis]|uniref:heavy metal translocating P-type ATPase n=1 Tax=Natronomonas gomsonensis TaxID=1046043 RepID=UPI0020CA3941|nr:cation-translocating P-type ATPase [Natronomonas gomsonensis]MCY4730753.1 cation-translocating P-type ATPase [Natronomonas gomsonensis]